MEWAGRGIRNPYRAHGCSENFFHLFLIFFFRTFMMSLWRRSSQLTPVVLPGESPRTEEPGRLQSLGLQKVRHY